MVLVLTHAGGARARSCWPAFGPPAPGHRVPEDHPVLRPARLHPGRVPPGGQASRRGRGCGRCWTRSARTCGSWPPPAISSPPTSKARSDETAVARYYRGRAEATGFTVADRAVEGISRLSLEQLRWALDTGVAPVLICSALAQGVRLLGRVGTAPRGANSAALAAEVGAPPWKIDRVRQQLRGWHPRGCRPCAASGRRSGHAGQGRGRQRRLRAGTGGPPDRSQPFHRVGDPLSGPAHRQAWAAPKLSLLKLGVPLGDRRLAVRGLVLVDDALASRLVKLTARQRSAVRPPRRPRLRGLAELRHVRPQLGLGGLVTLVRLFVLLIALDLRLYVRHAWESFKLSAG